MGEVLIFTKVPQRGKVKTRLERKYSKQAVEQIYTAFLKDTVDKLSMFEPHIAFYPERLFHGIWYLLGEQKYLAQRGKDLGEKMANAFSDFYKNKMEYVLVVGCDVPLLTPEIVYDAFEKMRDNDLVLGPSFDGGYYLIGGAGVTPELFEGVDWSQGNVLEKTASNAQQLGLKVGYTLRLRDVDHPEDLEHIWETKSLPKESHTYQVLKTLMD